MTAPTAEQREIPELTGQIGQYIFDRFCRDLDFRFGADKFRLAYDEECPGVDPFDLIIVRESDGKRFQLEVEVFVSEFTAQVTS